MSKFKIKNLKQNSYPFIFHMHGRPSLNKHGQRLMNLFFNSASLHYGSDGFFQDLKTKITYPKLKRGAPSELKHISIALFSNYKNLYCGSNSLDFLGHDYNIIGKNVANFKHIEKLNYLIRFCNSCQSEYVLFIDEPDLFCVKDLSGIIDIYKTFNCKVLFQSEGWFYPRSKSDIAIKSMEFFDKIAPLNNPYKYLNSGGILLETKFFKKISNHILNCNSYNPEICQSTYMSVFEDFYPDFQLDYQCKIFQSTAWSDWFTNKYGELQLEWEEN